MTKYKTVAYTTASEARLHHLTQRRRLNDYGFQGHALWHAMLFAQWRPCRNQKDDWMISALANGQDLGRA